jgi:hypothetical protein
VIAKTRRCVYFLVSRGITSKFTPISEIILLFRKIILPKLLFGIEVMIPSEAVIKQVNNFMAEALYAMTMIPKGDDPKDALWEAGIDTFEIELMKAKLKFHFKLSDDNPFPVKDLYTSENYLWIHIEQILTQVDLEKYNSVQLKEMVSAGTMKKWKWKKITNEALHGYANKDTKSRNPKLYDLKPHLHACEWLDKLSQRTCHLVLSGRRNTDKGKYTCKCGPQVIQNVVNHVLNECTVPELQISRLVTKQQISDLCPLIIEGPIELWSMIGLGRYMNTVIKRKDSNKVRELTIKLIVEGRENLTPI